MLTKITLDNFKSFKNSETVDLMKTNYTILPQNVADIASPIREGLQEAYVRQPLLFRWVCDEEWLNTVLERNNLCIYPIFSQYRYPDFTYR